MKKALSVLLIFISILALCLAGCGADSGGADNGGNTEIDWKTFQVGITCGDMSDALVNAICSGVKSRFEELGASASIAEYGNDPNNDIANIENFITMDVDIILDFCLDPAPLSDVTTKALQAGVKMVFAGAVPSYEFTSAVNTDHVTIGRQTSLMAIDWIDQRYPDAAEGSIHAAALNCTFIEALLNRSNEMMSVIESDPRVDLVFKKDGIQMLDEGFTAAEEALTMDPGIRLFVCANDGLALGASNYIVTLSDEDLTEFATFGSGLSEASISMAERSAANVDSVLRGLIGYGTADPAQGVFDCMYKTAIGEYTESSYVQWDEIYFIGSTGYAVTE